MLKQISGLLGLALLLSACECGSDTCQKVDAGVAVVPGSAEDFKANTSDRVHFAFNSARLSDSAHKALDQQAAWLKVNAAAKATVQGKCDSRGSEDYNLALGQKRADAAAGYLEKAGVAKDRVNTISYGKQQLEVVEDGSEEAYAKNRVAITVIN